MWFKSSKKKEKPAPQKNKECVYCNEIRRFKAKRLDDLEEALKKVPAGVQFVGNTLVEEKDGNIRLATFTSAADALKLIGQARKGELRLVF